MADTILAVKHLKKYFQTPRGLLHAVDGINLSIEKGETLGIVGESGSGKSTLAMALLRLHPKSTEITGEALFDGKDLFSISEAEMNELRWMKLAVVFQKAMNALSPVHRISTQIEDIYRVHCPNASGEEIQERAMELLRQTNQSIIDISQAVGFRDSAHFSRTFKQARGVSPRDYRRAAKNQA